MDKEELKNLLIKIDEEAFLELGVLTPRPKVIVVGGAFERYKARWQK